MALTLLYDFSTEAVINGTNHQLEHENIANKCNANIRSADLAADAGIALSQLAASYAFATANIRFSLAAGGWPAAGAILGVNGFAFVPFPDLGATWYPIGATWMISDAGLAAGNTAAFNISWGYFNTGVVNTWVSTQNITSVATAITVPAVNACGQQGNCTLATTTALTVSAQPRGFCIVSTAADANVLNVATDVFSCTILLKRQIIA